MEIVRSEYFDSPRYGKEHDCGRHAVCRTIQNVGYKAHKYMDVETL